MLKCRASALSLSEGDVDVDVDVGEGEADGVKGEVEDDPAADADANADVAGLLGRSEGNGGGRFGRIVRDALPASRFYQVMCRKSAKW